PARAAGPVLLAAAAGPPPAPPRAHVAFQFRHFAGPVGPRLWDLQGHRLAADATAARRAVAGVLSDQVALIGCRLRLSACPGPKPQAAAKSSSPAGTSACAPPPP